MRLGDVVGALEAIAPTRLAESWDNVGLLVGDPGAEVTRALLAVDLTAAVLDEARRERVELVVAYHPPIFAALKRLVAPHPAFACARDGIALYSPHTALDVAPGGTNDVLADAVGLVERAPLRLAANPDRQLKLVTFVPENAVDEVSAALFAAGAGRIGNYTACSFRAPGTGTFFGEAGAAPAVGEAGRLETVAELRLETLVPVDDVARVVAALRAAHPYEEPAFDLVRLAAAPVPVGIGRVGTMPAAPRRTVVERLRAALSLAHVLVAGPLDGDAGRVAICAGAGDDLVDDVLRAKAQMYICGELRHHAGLRLAAAGVTTVALLHGNSERPALAALAANLRGALPALEVRISTEDRDPYTVA